jgi:hypothetical protein
MLSFGRVSNLCLSVFAHAHMPDCVTFLNIHIHAYVLAFMFHTTSHAYAGTDHELDLSIYMYCDLQNKWEFCTALND